MKNNNCFYCLNHCNGQSAENTGWYHPCKLGIENEGLQNVKGCPSYSPNVGFQIGGYYSHIHFDYDKESPNSCMEMIIHSDGEFPTEDTNRQIQFHICDFRQLEHFVKEWGEYFRKIGVVTDFELNELNSLTNKNKLKMNEFRDEYLKKDTSYNRLLSEYKKHGKLCIGFDFDSTVYDYHKKGESYDQVRQLLRDLKNIDCELVCWTANQDLEYVAKFLDDNNIPYDGINSDGIPLPWKSRKPFFSALLDDRAGLKQVYEELSRLVKEVNFERKNIHTRVS